MVNKFLIFSAIDKTNDRYNTFILFYQAQACLPVSFDLE